VNFFDTVTHFEMLSRGMVGAHSATFYFDGFELYREDHPENLAQVYGLNGVYVPSRNELFVAWRRHEEEEEIPHEVRYAFAAIHESGWDMATPAPEGVVQTEGHGGANGMEWATTRLDLRGREKIYIAIKPQNSELFRQISIPLPGGRR